MPRIAVFFYSIGKSSELSYRIKSPPGGVSKPPLLSDFSVRKLGVLFGRESGSFGESPEEAAVVLKAAGNGSLGYGIALSQQLFGLGDSFGSDIFSDGSSGSGFKKPADVRGTEIKLSGKNLCGKGFCNMLIYIR